MAEHNIKDLIKLIEEITVLLDQHLKKNVGEQRKQIYEDITAMLLLADKLNSLNATTDEQNDIEAYQVKKLVEELHLKFSKRKKELQLGLKL